MNKGLYSYFDWISYVLCGLIILVSIDIAFDGFGEKIIKYADIINVNGMQTVFVLAVAYLLGHANSHIAHWVLQEFVTSTALGRPSRRLLFPSQSPRFLTLFKAIKYFQLLDSKNRDAIFSRLKAEGYNDVIENNDDQKIFKLAFTNAQKIKGFNEDRAHLANAFNFSRNMAMALFFVLILFVYKYNTSCVLEVLECKSLLSEVYIVLWVTAILMVIVVLRYLHFLHTLTSHILIEYGCHEPSVSDAKNIELIS